MNGISIITCSINSDLFNSFEANVNSTIGDVSYEIIKVDNNVMKLPITKAYNHGASKAKYDFLLFVHEDVIFHTSKWGHILINELNDEKVGVIGVAGSNYVPFAPIGYRNILEKYNFYHLIQRRGSLLDHQWKLPADLFSIKALDGVFLAVRKSTWETFKFNEKLNGFHAYDLDFSLRISQSLKNKITKDVLIEHFSLGNIDETYFRNTIQVKKRELIQNKKNDYFNEYSTYREFVRNLHRFNFNNKEIFTNGIKFLSIKRYGLFNYLKSVLFLVSSFVKKMN